jgi:hypothetical protein
MLVWAAGLAVIGAYAYSVASGRLTHGFVAYYAAARALAAGRVGAWVYDEPVFMPYLQDLTGTTVLDIFGPNPPSMSLLLLPIASLDPMSARAVWLIASLAAWAWASAALVRRLPTRAAATATVAVALMLLGPPVFANIRNAQAYLLVAAAQIAAALCLLNRRDIAAGTLLGTAIATKTSGLPMLFVIAAARRWRAATAVVATCAALAAVTLATGGLEAWLRYPAYVLEFVRQPRAAVTAYQTTSSLFRRICVADQTWNPGAAASCPAVAWTMPWILVAGALLVTLRAAVRSPAPLWLAAGACLSLLALPVAEDHQFVLLALPLMLLVESRLASGGDRSSAWGLFVFGVLYAVPLDDTAHRFVSGWGVLLAYPRLYATWLLWLLVIREMKRPRSVEERFTRPRQTHARASS